MLMLLVSLLLAAAFGLVVAWSFLVFARFLFRTLEVGDTWTETFLMIAFAGCLLGLMKLASTYISL